MSPPTEGFLLTVAQIAATLIGLLLVGVLFYAETGLRQLTARDLQAAPYLRAGVRWVLLLYSMVLGLALSLVVLDAVWVTGIFAVFSIAVAAALGTFSLRALELSRVRPDWLPSWSVWLPWPPTLLTLGLPWVLGGLAPGPEAFLISLLLAGGLAFLSTASLVLLTFEFASPTEADS